MAENRVKFGLRNVHYAPYELEGGIPVYAKPIPFPGAVELTLDPRGDLVEFYADDMLYYSASNNQGYDGTYTAAEIPEQFAIDALGEELDDEDGVVHEMADSKGKPFALLFEFDGDVKATRHILYNCTANRSSFGSATKTATAEPNTNELSFVASPMDIEGRRMVKTKTTSRTTADVYNSWFTEVYVKAPATV